MKALPIVGIILILVGVYALATGGVLTGRKDVLHMGDMRLSTETRQSVPPWVGWSALVLGGGLVAAGFVRKS